MPNAGQITNKSAKTSILATYLLCMHMMNTSRLFSISLKNKLL